MTWNLTLEGYMPNVDAPSAKEITRISYEAGAEATLIGFDGQVTIWAFVEAPDAEGAIALAHPIRVAVNEYYPELGWYGVNASGPVEA